ncbi:MAG: hypothetical protein V9F00_06985 [Nocardioides sp.]
MTSPQEGQSPTQALVDETVAEYDSPVRPSAEPTGSSAVDRVLDSLEDLDRVPLEEHPAIFEQAHSALRRALDEPAAELDDED